MKIKHYTLPEHALSGQRQLTHFHFGEPGRGEKIYLQAGLHADEIPGMLVLHYLKRLLNQAERRAELRGEIILKATYAFQAGTGGEVYLLRELLIRNAAIPAQDFKDLVIDTVKPGFLFHR